MAILQTRTCLAAVLWMTVACSGQTYSPQIPSPTQPSAPVPPPAPAPPPSVRDIAIGEVVEDKIDESHPPCTTRNGWGVPCRHFRLTAPADGTLVALLTYDPYAVGVILMLRMEEADIYPTGAPWSPVVGRLRVASGQSYRLAVGLAGADESGGDKFTLTTAIE
jgi:hypothetical protein